MVGEDHMNLFRRPRVRSESEHRTDELQRQVEAITERVVKFVAEQEVMSLSSTPGRVRMRPRNGNGKA